MVKKIIVLTLVCAMLAVAFAGCSASPAASSAAAPASSAAPAASSAAPAASSAAPASAAASSAAPASAAAGTMVGLAMPTKSLQRWNQDGSNMQDQFQKAGYTVDLEYANNDVATQVQQLENMITKGCKVLVIAAVDAGALQTVMDDAKKANIVIFAYDRLIKGASYYATFDNEGVGKLQGQWVVDHMKLDSYDAKTNGPVRAEIFGGSPDDNNAFVFNKGELDILQKYIDNGTIKIMSGQTSMDVIAIKAWDSGTAQKRMDNLLTANYADKPVQLVISPNDSLAQGIAASLKAAGYTPNDASAKKPWPVLTGQDCDILSMKNMLAGMQSMSIFKDTRALAAQTVKMVGQILTGAKVDVNNTTDYDNVPSFLLTPVAVDLTNYKATLVDAGYYTQAQIESGKIS